MTQHELHPLCTLFPRMQGAEFDSLVADIREHGLREPITLHDGMILDGGNRYRACLEAGVSPRFVKFANGNPVSFVLSANLHRRHLTQGQQATIVASAQDWGSAHTHGGSRKSDQEAILPLDSIATRAAQSGTSERTQKMADKVVRERPDLARKVAHGETTLPRAIEQITGKRPGSKPSKTDPRDAEIASLREALAESRDNARELAAMVEASDFAAQGEASAAKQIKRLLDEIATLKSQRDGYMTKCNELIKTVKHWKHKAGAK